MQKIFLSAYHNEPEITQITFSPKLGENAARHITVKRVSSPTLFQGPAQKKPKPAPQPKPPAHSPTMFNQRGEKRKKTDTNDQNQKKNFRQNKKDKKD